MNAIILAILLAVPGDVNQSGSVNIADVMALVDYIFNGVEIPRTEWVEVDTTVSVVWILDRAFLTSDWPIRVQNRYHVYATIIDGVEYIDTALTTEVVIEECRYPILEDSNYFHVGKPLIRTW